MAKMLKITQVRSLIGSPPKHKLTMKAIGFRHHQQTLTKTDTPQLRGMLVQVRHLVSVEEIAASARTKTPRPPSQTGSVEKKPAPAKTESAAAKTTKTSAAAESDKDDSKPSDVEESGS